MCLFILLLDGATGSRPHRRRTADRLQSAETGVVATLLEGGSHLVLAAGPGVQWHGEHLSPFRSFKEKVPLFVPIVSRLQ